MLCIARNGYIIGENGVLFATTDEGMNWTRINLDMITNLNDIYFVSRDTGYICGDNGTMLSTINQGKTWKKQVSNTEGDLNTIHFWNNGIGIAGGDNSQLIFTSLGELFDGTESDFTNTSIQKDNIFEDLQDYKLYQNYPNPFNPETEIRYNLPASSFVQLKIYDILGKEISVLENGFKNDGTHSVKFDGSNLASGVYFYVLTTRALSGDGESRILVNKMMLLK